MQLNPQQQQAVETIKGPCLVIAGAGSGKTRVIINKIKNLIKNGIPEQNIYAVTFTNKAAAEMRERLKADLKSNAKVNISTFHTLGLDFVKREYKRLNLKERVILSDPHDQRVLLRDLILHTNLQGVLDEQISLVMNFISTAKNKLMLPGDLPENPLEFSKNPDFIQNYQIYSKLYHYYFTYMQSISTLDFDDLILLPTTLLKYNRKVREKYNKRVQYLLVDEYQDTNTSQYEFVKLLVGENPNFTVVGDDDQSIYSWRGAQPENLVRLQQDFPNLQVIFLEQNYRSTENILEAANKLIANNPHVYQKQLKSVHGKGELIKVVAHENPEEEAFYVVNSILSHKFEHNTKFGDYAVLYRGNHQSRLLEKEFAENDVPIVINGDTSFFEKAEIKDCVAYLRLLSNFDDDKALMRVINVPRREIGSKTVTAIGEVAKLYNCSFFDACFHEDLLTRVNGRALFQLQEFLELITHTAERINENNDFLALKQFFDELDYEQFLYEQSDNKKVVETQMKNIENLLDMVRRWMSDSYYEPMTLSEVVQRLFLRELSASKAKDDTDNFVQLMTIHASKGLEFPYVHIIGCEEETIPHKNSIEEDNIEEERRLMYVGITRAQKELTLNYSLQAKRAQEVQDLEVSRFIGELPEEVLEVNEAVAQRASTKKKEQDAKNYDSLIAHINKSRVDNSKFNDIYYDDDYEPLE
ncbi:hypothetical protein CJP74_05150 [Psittacicella melopsittaci]|uniref:DNA 3'-5' helicase n=1 Tax=Psittacicella melopsittaci TaxID=2028576 RepID=A0A3A1Y3L4_9GAMM|nr:UvrD-helicase domain-containing protein [Psittacicella melopsittaci]RIY32155.1 hypothetical protein CJP74_05150 [Psittacicella melopsittaci]